jgi:hypothetical protein
MGVLDTVKDTVKLVQQIDNIELYRRILDLQRYGVRSGIFNFRAVV